MESGKWRDIGERESAAGATAEQTARVSRAEFEAADAARVAAEDAAEASAARETEAAQHNLFLQRRVEELEDAAGADSGAHYGAELRRLRETRTADAAKVGRCRFAPA